MPPGVHAAPARARNPLPAGFRLVADSSLTDLGGGALLGGSPLRLVQLRPPAGEMLAQWLDGVPIAPEETEALVARRVVSHGLVQPIPPEGGHGSGDVTVVVPVRDRAHQLATLLTSLEGLRVMVVDDGSVAAEDIRRVATRRDADLLRLPASRGPGAARDAGLERTSTDLVAFVDSDCIPEPGWLPTVLAHFQDPLVGAVAARIRPTEQPELRTLGAYEMLRSPLDRGPEAGLVRPGSRIPFVPTAALVVRRAALGSPCFDHGLVGGEDVDLVWRMVAAGWDVRYEPRAVVRHDRDDHLSTWLGRRAFYGATAGPLARRHPGSLAPASANAWTVAAWGLTAARHPALGAVAVGVSVAVLADRLRGTVDAPWRAAARIAAGGTVRAAVPAVAGTARAYAPALVAGCAWRRTRSFAAAWLLVPALADWFVTMQSRPAAEDPGPRPDAIGPVRYVAAHVADDVAYATGVWIGCIRARTPGPLVPRVTLRSGAWSRRSGLGATPGEGGGGRPTSASRARRVPSPPPWPGVHSRGARGTLRRAFGGGTSRSEVALRRTTHGASWCW